MNTKLPKNRHAQNCLNLYLRSCLRILFFILSIFTMLADVSSANEPTGTAPDIQRIIDRGKIIVAMLYEDIPPFFMHNKKGELIGIDVELSQDIAKRLGVRVEFNRSSKTFDAVTDSVGKREADVAISMLSDTLNRATRVRFSDSYVMLRQALLINRLQLAQRYPSSKSHKNIRKLLNQKGINIGTIAGSSYVYFSRRDYPLAAHTLYDDWDAMLHDTMKGNLFALLFDEVQIKNLKYDFPDIGLRLKTVMPDDRKDSIAFAVHRDDHNLLAWLNLYLRKIKDDGVLEKLIDTYIQQEDWRKQ